MNISSWTCSETSSQKNKKQLSSTLMTGRQITEMICDHFKISYTDGTVLDLSDHLRIELKNDSVQSFDTKMGRNDHRDEETKR